MNVFELLITTPLGYVISTIYQFLPNYGWTIILFTFIIKLIMSPLAIKQQKSMTKMQRVKPLLEHIQAKYKDDPNRLNQETMKLYKEQGINPAGGCLPLLIQFPILIGLYQVINRPLSFILHLPADIVEKLTQMFASGNANNVAAQIEVCSKLDPALVQQELGITVEKLNFWFFGLDLSQQPQLMYLNWLWLIPILSAATAYFSSYITQKLQGMPQQEGTMKTMTLLMPLMSAYFCFILPAGVGL